ncbi:MAG TPA: DNA recombination protein RmuC [Terracidiphilus sp.]|jgi:DNA recombination protein RmuC|nr:DNA recombination protein RmuC [Terracidiphilus sp.]
MQALLPVLLAVLGIVVVFLFHRVSARNERDQASQRAAELSADLAAARAQLLEAQALSASRAGFESLAAERQAMIDRLTDERGKSASDLQSRIDSELALARQVSQLQADLRNERQNMAEKIALLDEGKKALSDQFQALAADILDQKSKTFADASRKDLDTLLNPLREQIGEFRKKVEETQTDSKLGVNTLQTLIGNLNSMNQQLTEEARNLTTALRGSSKTQGDWGELIVRNLLEKAGLREGEQFRVQESFEAPGSDGDRRRLRPDVILNLPGGRHLVIDSKVSLNAWSDSVDAATEDARKLAMKRHLTSIRAHVDGLAARNYHKLAELESPDFVIMFVPIEPAFLAALHQDEALWRYAYEKEVLLVGPTTLLFVIRIVDNLWQQELQARNVQEVIDRGAELYEKFVGFVTDMEVLGDSLHKSDQHYENAMKKLADGRGNLIRQVEMLKKLGLRTSKSIPKALLDRANVDQAELALAAEAEDETGAGI